MKPYFIAPLARQDIVETVAYIAVDNLRAAQRWHDQIDKKILWLSSHALAGSICENIQDDLRNFAVGNYVIYYRINHNQIEIVRVLHGARDAEFILGADDDDDEDDDEVK